MVRQLLRKMLPLRLLKFQMPAPLSPERNSRRKLTRWRRCWQ